MKKNIGTVDTIIRVIFAILIGILYLTDVISGPVAVVLGIIAFVLLVTGVVGWCGLYAAFGINTCRKKS